MTGPSRRAAFALALAAAAADLMLLRPGAATADAPVAVGSWHLVRQHTPAGAVPSTPLTHDGTLPVQNGPAGPLAFSAVRYEAADATGGTLTLTFAGQPPVVAPPVDACAVTTGWQSGADQTWDRRPTYDCAHAVQGSVSAGRMTWRVGADLLRSRALDVALVAAPGDPTPFAVSFAVPAGDSFAPVTGSSAPPLPVGAAVPGSAAAATSTPAPAPASADVPQVSAGAPGAEAPPVVAPTPGAGDGTASLPATRAAATRRQASRAVGAAGLAALAFLLLLRSLVGAGPGGRPAKSLVTVRREPANG